MNHERHARVPAVRLERTLAAPPHEVYRAWLDPEILRRWMAPGCFTVGRAEVQARVGGRFRIWHADAGSDVGGFECEILELGPDQRLVFRWGFVGPERAAGTIFDSRLTVTLRPVEGERTLLTLVHERLEDLAAAMPHVVDQVEAGWDQAFAKLAGLFAAEADVAGAASPNVGKES
jgi:uncharacterized protein YndB with AHSA1/START domain